MSNKLQRGSTLIEALLALTFAVAIITAVVVAVTSSLNNATYTKSQNAATQYAQEGIDIARYMKSSDYDSFISLATSFGGGPLYCPTQDGILEISDVCTKDQFLIEIYIDHGTALSGGRDKTGVSQCEVGSSFVSSTASWTDPKCTNGDFCHKVALDTCLSDLDKLNNP